MCSESVYVWPPIYISIKTLSCITSSRVIALPSLCQGRVFERPTYMPGPNEVLWLIAAHGPIVILTLRATECRRRIRHACYTSFDCHLIMNGQVSLSVGKGTLAGTGIGSILVTVTIDCSSFVMRYDFGGLWSADGQEGASLTQWPFSEALQAAAETSGERHKRVARRVGVGTRRTHGWDIRVEIGTLAECWLLLFPVGCAIESDGPVQRGVHEDSRSVHLVRWPDPRRQLPSTSSP